MRLLPRPPCAAGRGGVTRPPGPKRRHLALPSTPRSAAVEQLLRIEQGGAYVGLVDRADGEAGNRQGARTTTDLVAGATRLRRRLDYTIQALSGRAMADIEPGVRQVLRIALLELTELGVPAHALAAHVDLARAVGGPRAAAFANAVLRAAAAGAADGSLPLPQAPGEGASPRERVRCLAAVGSHPDWMVKRWLARFGQAETEALMAWNNSRPHHCVRANPDRGGVPALVERLRAAGVDAAPSAVLPSEFVRVTSGMASLLASGVVADGGCQVQDEAAGAVVAALDPQPGEAVLDVCAAPGGKALFVAARMQGEGRLVARDASDARLGALRSAAAAQRVGPPFLTVEAGDGTAPPPLSEQGSYDRVLLDAPCCGTGVLAKRADLRWRRTADDVAGLAGLQDALLDAAAAWVRPGGVLVYSTCSLEPEENGERVAAFLARRPDFSVEPPPPGALPAALVTAAGYVECLPHRHGVDGAFAARLRRRE